MASEWGRQEQPRDRVKGGARVHLESHPERYCTLISDIVLFQVELRERVVRLKRGQPESRRLAAGYRGGKMAVSACLGVGRERHKLNTRATQEHAGREGERTHASRVQAGFDRKWVQSTFVKKRVKEARGQHSGQG